MKEFIKNLLTSYQPKDYQEGNVTIMRRSLIPAFQTVYSAKARMEEKPHGNTAALSVTGLTRARL